MTSNQWSRLELTLPAVALVLGLAGAAGSFPVGSYDSDAYTLTFDTTGTFFYMRDTSLMVQGTYMVHDTTIAVTDVKGRDACVGAGRNPGLYRWDLEGGDLRFRTIHDPCPERIQGIADQTWKPHHARQ